ncbi:PHA/PHB synthase family protein [Halodurantibacterium flavum]|uniref:PHA/PHB synthase family protein n=1 Tax=Halodurantibacterium flavum TaxID=1382802 RepID=A0ABW4S730_9RHOB
MTTDDDAGAAKLERLNANLVKIEELSQRLVAALGRRKAGDPGLQGPSQDIFMKAAMAYVTEMMHNPAKIFEHQISYWGKSLKHYIEAQQALATGKLAAPEDRTPADPRFADPTWQTHPYFNYLKQQYLLSAEAMQNAVSDLDHVDPREKRRIDYFTRQIIDMFSPTNFLGTNPEALARAVETDGESLVRGMENLVRDIEANEGDLLVTLADRKAFHLGENIACTEGSVVFRNRMFELIQYAPTTDKVRRTPLIIFPPWINKFYVLDLSPRNSLIRWMVDQGFTLFVVSWVNPDASYRDVGLDTYIEEGYLEAIAQAKAITGEDRVNVTGYCIGGTTLALTLALLEKRRDKSVRSATFFTTLTDFSDQGEMAVFLEEDFLAGIERECGNKGFLHSLYMSRTFSYLRSNDLIYKPAIRSYMMGDAPPAFDLLYWNGDGTNLPGRMAVEYLRGLCQHDAFARDGYDICGETLRLRDVRVPLCAIACETDHIANWKSSYTGIAAMGARDKTFILSQSGHIAGIVNPPEKKKYGHYVNPDLSLDPDAWRDGAEFTPGSWWPRWADWLSKRAGAMVPARKPGDSGRPLLGSAPGSYVRSAPNA